MNSTYKPILQQVTIEILQISTEAVGHRSMTILLNHFVCKIEMHEQSVDAF